MPDKDEKASRLMSFFSDKDVFYGFWRILVMSSSVAVILASAWLHQFKNHIEASQEELKKDLKRYHELSIQENRALETRILVLEPTLTYARENCNRIQFLERELEKKVDRAAMASAVMLFSEKIDAIRSDMGAFNIKILEYLRDNKTETR